MGPVTAESPVSADRHRMLIGRTAALCNTGVFECVRVLAHHTNLVVISSPTFGTTIIGWIAVVVLVALVNV